jgi:Domain of unknown function (DUF4352)
MTYDPTGPYPPDQNYQWQPPAPQPGYPPPGTPTSGTPGYPISGTPGYPTSGAPGYPTSGGAGYPPPGYGYPPQQQPPKRSYTGLIIALIVGIVVVGCGGTVAVLAIVGSKPSPHPTSQSRSSRGPAATSTGGATTSTTSGPVPFGADHGVRWNDKLEATVLSVKRFTPSTTAAGTHPGQVGIKVTVKITNNTTQQFDLTLAGVKVKSGDNGTQADTIFDSENNLGIGFEGSIAPGHSATADYGFSVPPGDLGKIDVEVTPGFDYDPGIFEGSAS